MNENIYRCFKVGADISGRSFVCEFKIGQLVVMLVFLTLVFTLAYCWYRERKLLFEREMDLQVHKLYEESFKEVINTSRCRQHEFHNHIQAILSMHYTIQDYDELVREQEKYCREVMEDQQFYRLLNTNWPVLTGFLYSKFVEASKRKIRVIYSIKIQGTIQKVPEFVVIETLGILMDNAIEASEQAEDPVIYVSIREEERFQIDIANPADGLCRQDLLRFFERGYSTKAGHSGLELNRLTESGRKYGFERKALLIEYEGRTCVNIRVLI